MSRRAIKLGGDPLHQRVRAATVRIGSDVGAQLADYTRRDPRYLWRAVILLECVDTSEGEVAPMLATSPVLPYSELDGILTRAHDAVRDALLAGHDEPSLPGAPGEIVDTDADTEPPHMPARKLDA